MSANAGGVRGRFAGSSPYRGPPKSQLAVSRGPVVANCRATRPAHPSVSSLSGKVLVQALTPVKSRGDVVGLARGPNRGVMGGQVASGPQQHPVAERCAAEP